MQGYQCLDMSYSRSIHSHTAQQPDAQHTHLTNTCTPHCAPQAAPHPTPPHHTTLNPCLIVPHLSPPSPQGLRVLEGLSATGLRSIRYALELDGVSQIDANDLDPTVVEAMRRNISMNGPDVEAKVQPHCSDARLLMLQNPYVSVMRACRLRHVLAFAMAF